MTYVVRTEDQVDHEVDEITDSGNFVTKCQNLFGKDSVVAVQQDVAITCMRCLEPPKPLELPKPRRARAPNAKPQWRQARNVRAETIQGMKFAHKAIVAALEWMERGEEGQFLELSLDQIHLGYRFLGEILVTFHRIPDPEIDEPE